MSGSELKHQQPSNAVTMIVTITANPTLDITYHVPELLPGDDHRVQKIYTNPGGKGINVARVLHQLGEQTFATGFLGGNTGETIAALLDKSEISYSFIPSNHSTRQSVTIIDPVHAATLFNEPGKPYSDEQWGKFFSMLRALPTPHVFTVNGSFPPGTSEDIVRRLYRELLSTGAPVLVDTSGEPLRWAIDEGVHAIKPNTKELLHLCSDSNATHAIERLLKKVELVVASRGSDGMIAQARDGEAVAVPAARFVAGNPTGAGDAVVASLARSIAHEGIDAARRTERLRAWVADAIALSAAAVAAPVAGEYDEKLYRDLLQMQAESANFSSNN